MANPDALNQQRASNRLLQPTVKSHLAYTLLCALVMMVMFSLLRLALLAYNREMILDTPASTFLEAFANGLRLDIRLVVYLTDPACCWHCSACGPWPRGGSSVSG